MEGVWGILTTVVAVLAIGSIVSVTLRKQMQAALSALTANNDITTTSHMEEGLVQRMESIERRMEEVHADSMRYLKKASTMEARARKMSGSDELEDEDEASPEEAMALRDSIAQPQPENASNGAQPVYRPKSDSVAYKLRRLRR